jgi:hypothetical protein
MVEGVVEGRWIITDIDKTSNAPCAGHEEAD